MQLYAIFFMFAVALVALVKGSDLFVSSASRLARHFGVSEFVIGLTLVALGTSLPELASSIAASFTHNSGIIIGNITGSNIANIGLVVGLVAFYAGLRIRRKIFYEDAYIMLIVSLLFFLFASDSVISRYEAAMLIVAFVLYAGRYSAKLKLKELRNVLKLGPFARYLLRLRSLLTLKRLETAEVGGKEVRTDHRVPKKVVKEAFELQLIKQMFLLVISLALVIYGAKYLVNSASQISLFLRVPQSAVAFVLVAVGTSLPELSICMSAIKKGYDNMVIGNIVGSNILNVLLIVGISSMIHPLSVSLYSLTYLFPAMLLFSLFFLGLVKLPLEKRKMAGLTLLLLYVIMIVFVVLSSV